MKDVEFEVFDVTSFIAGGGEVRGNNQSAWATDRRYFKYDSVEGYYKLENSAGIATKDKLPTGNDGNVKFTLPYHTDGTPYVFAVREIVPDGYNASIPPIFTITVTMTEIEGEYYANFAVDIIQCQAGTVEISKLLEPYPDYIAGAIVHNISDKVDVTVSKVWESGLSFDVILAQIIGEYVDDDNVLQTVVKDVKLNDANSWTKTLTLPVMIENHPVRYHVVEAEIESKPLSYYDNIITTVDYNCTGDSYNKNFDESTISGYSIYDVDHINATITNGYPAHEPITFKIHNLDAEDHLTGLHNAVFELYRETDFGDYTIQGNKASLIGSFKFLDSNEKQIILDSGYVYYLKQTAAQEGYSPVGTYIKIAISGIGEIAVTPNDNIVDKYTAPVSDGEKAMLDIYNARVQEGMPAPTNYSSQGQFAQPMLIAGLFLGALALIPVTLKYTVLMAERRKRRRRWMPCAKK